MKILVTACGKRPTLAWGLVSIVLLSVAALAQTSTGRITGEIDNSVRVLIPGTHSPRARQEDDAGRVPQRTGLQGITLMFSRTAVQEADLQVLIAAQQNPASPLYHQWLTPDEFAVRFGVADSDIAKVTSWLEQQGFSVDAVSRSKNRVTFSGTVGQVEAVFGTEMHYFSVDGKTRFAPSTDISVPAALASLVQTVGNLSTFRPKPHVRLGRSATAPRPLFTSSQSGSHFLSPGDIAVIYDINSAYKAGYTGAGQAIAIVGQSEIYASDIENFQSAAGLPTKAPTMILVPNSGTPEVSSGDEAESDLDVEWSGAIATGASIYLVYVGNNSSYSVWDSIAYAVDVPIVNNNTQMAPVISTSYGVCEQALGSSEYSSLNAILEQAAAQGQSVIAAAGDDGSTDCYGTLKGSQGEVLAVDFPASSQYVAGMGGTEFPAADVAASYTTTKYWQGTTSSGSDVIASALSYIPEVVWNDDSSTEGIAAGGGGVSTITPRPTWQAGVTGIPSGSYRLVPDISLDASAENAPYLICSSDSAWTGVTGSCSHGFRDSNDEYLTVAGGTSFGAPIFAGMVAIINGKLNSTGQGVVNSSLYTLAAESSNYVSNTVITSPTAIFNNITSGSNECTAGSQYCSSAGESECPAAPGYNEASGLGSINFYNLLMAWPTPSSPTLTASTTTLAAQTTTPTAGAGDTITITVASASSSSTATPIGTLTIVVDGTTQTSSLGLTNGSATYTFSSMTIGSHIIVANYSGNSTYSSSSGSLTVKVVASSPTLTASTTTLAVQTTTPTAGAGDTITITVASASSSSTATPTGTLTIVVDGTTQTSSLGLTNGSATYTFSSMTIGSHVIVANYSGNSTYSSSSGSLTVNVIASSVITPAPTITSLSPSPTARAGSPAFTLTVNGSNFGNGATVLWSGSTLTTTWVSMSQLTASVPAADLTSASIVPVTVANPASLGGQVSSPFDFVINTAAGTAGAFTVNSTTTTLNVQYGQSTTTAVPVTFSGTASGAVITFSGCYNQPAGVSCSYGNGVITITTSTSTPTGTYDDIVAVFTATQQTAALTRGQHFYLATWFGLTAVPLGFLWMGSRCKKVLLRCLILLFVLSVILLLGGCGGGGTSSNSGAPTITTTQSSLTLTLSVVSK
jgi:hypothetical protein